MNEQIKESDYRFEFSNFFYAKRNELEKLEYLSDYFPFNFLQFIGVLIKFSHL